MATCHVLLPGSYVVYRQKPRRVSTDLPASSGYHSIHHGYCLFNIVMVTQGYYDLLMEGGGGVRKCPRCFKFVEKTKPPGKS